MNQSHFSIALAEGKLSHGVIEEWHCVPGHEFARLERRCPEGMAARIESKKHGSRDEYPKTACIPKSTNPAHNLCDEGEVAFLNDSNTSAFSVDPPSAPPKSHMLLFFRGELNEDRLLGQFPALRLNEDQIKHFEEQGSVPFDTVTTSRGRHFRWPWQESAAPSEPKVSHYKIVHNLEQLASSSLLYPAQIRQIL